MLYILFVYPVVSILIFLILNKFWGKRNNVILNIFYSITLCIFLPLEILFWVILRKKYNNKTRIVLKKLNALEFKYHIVFGTFLFAFRNNNFKDTDIDICVFRDDFNNEQQKKVLKAGFILKEQWSLDGKICEQTYINKKLKVSMDIFQIGRGEEFAPTFDEKNQRYARRPVAYRYDVKKYLFCGIELYAPANPEEYLGWNYGEWQKNDSNYHWLYGSSSSPAEIVKSNQIKYEKM